jgi:Cu+-exporting ATPase
MHPEIEQSEMGACPKCGMALELIDMSTISTGMEEYVCPMHPEVVQDHPGSCPKCGMALEPRTVAAQEDDSELKDMTRRFWGSALLAIPVFISAMGAEIWPQIVDGVIAPHTRQWFEMMLATPVVFWGGWIFFTRGWQSIITRNLNMFTLITASLLH